MAWSYKKKKYKKIKYRKPLQKEPTDKGYLLIRDLDHRLKKQPFLDGVQLPQGYSHLEEADYFLILSSQKFLVLVLLTSEGWKAVSTLEPPSSYQHGTYGLGIQRLNH